MEVDSDYHDGGGYVLYGSGDDDGGIWQRWWWWWYMAAVMMMMQWRRDNLQKLFQYLAPQNLLLNRSFCPPKFTNAAYSSFQASFRIFLTPHISLELSDSFCVWNLESVPFLKKIIKKIGTNFSRGKLERKLLIYPPWLLFHIIIFTAIVIFTYILFSRATLYPLLMLVVLRHDLISVLDSRL